MASDDTEQFRASQSKHSAKIAFERQLGDATGLSRSQIRSRLGGALGSFVEAFQNRRGAERAEVKVNRQDKMIIEPPTIFRTPPFVPFPSVSATPVTTDEAGGGGGTTLPSGNKGDMLVYDGSDWVILARPTSMSVDPVMRYNLSTDVPYWEEPDAGC